MIENHSAVPTPGATHPVILIEDLRHDPNLRGQMRYHHWRHVRIVIGKTAVPTPISELNSQSKPARTGKAIQQRNVSRRERPIRQKFIRRSLVLHRSSPDHRSSGESIGRSGERSPRGQNAQLRGHRAYTALQASADPLFVRGRRYYWKAHFLKAVSDAAIDALVDGYARAASPLSLAVLQQMGGAIARVAGDATAYANRDAAYDCFPVAVWEDAADDGRQIAWARAFWEAMRPFATGGVYANNLGDEGEQRVRAAYGQNYTRLAALKAQYDPDNLFRLNPNVRPAG